MSGPLPREVNGLSAELALLLACGAPPSESAGRRICALLAGPLDWPRLIDVADAQGMLPLLLRGINMAGPDEAAHADRLQALRNRAIPKALRSVKMADELARLLRTFEDAGLTPVAFKGPALSWLAYGDLALRVSDDLDIFVPRAQLNAALDLLAAEGFKKQTAAWDVRFSGACEIALRRGDPRCDVDVHWRFSSPYFLDLDPERAAGRSNVLRAGDFAARTLCPEDHLLYLSIHAAREGWAAMRLPCDIAGLVARCALDWDDVMRESRRAGAWRALAVGLNMARGLCGAPAPPEILERVERDHAVLRISARARQALANLASDPSGTPAGALFHLGLLESPFAKARYLWRRALQPNHKDAAWVHLPLRLQAGYYLLRPVRVAGRALGLWGRG